VGYSTIQAVLTGGLTLPSLLILLFVAKLCATSISLGSGSSGGIFSPSLFMGATIGGAFGALLTAVHPVEGVTTTTSAIVGMAAMVGGGTGAAMRGHHDFQNDARLRPGHAQHRRGCTRHRHT
jgi:CIC family chloride channel protein